MKNAKNSTACRSGVRKISATPAGFADERGDREQQEIAAEKRQHQRQLVDAVGDEDAGDQQHRQRERRDLRQRAPPALAGVEDVERYDQRERRRIEDVGRRVRTRYLLTTATAEVAGGRTRLCGLRTIATSSAVSTAPLGNSQRA